jgi:hypothetical protein
MTPPQGPIAPVEVKFITKPADEDFEPDIEGYDLLEEEPLKIGGQVLQVRYSNDNPLKEHQIILQVRVPEIEESVPPFVLRLNEASHFEEGINSALVFLAQPYIVGDRRVFLSVKLGSYFDPEEFMPTQEKVLRKRILEVVPRQVAQHYGLIPK